MATNRPAPSLDSRGWIENVQEKADYIITWAFLENFSASRLYHGRISSPHKIFQMHADNIPRMTESLRAMFEDLLGRYFDMVTVQISESAETALDSSGPAKLEMTCTITHEGNNYQLAKLIGVSGSKFELLTTVINDGENIE